VGKRGEGGVIIAHDAFPTQGDRSRTSSSQSQSHHSPPRPRAGNHLHSRPGDSLREHRSAALRSGRAGQDRLASAYKDSVVQIILASPKTVHPSRINLS
jgi:hypothetical protein